MTALLLLLGAVGVAGEHVPTEAELAVHRALSGRHFSGDCASVEALAPAPVETLLAVVEHASAPPWAPMRAAACLTRGHAVEIEPQLLTWVTDPNLRGLGIQTLTLLDAMPEPVAVAVARNALAHGPAELDAATRIGEARSDAVRAVLLEPLAPMAPTPAPGATP